MVVADPISITLVAGVVTLVLDRLYKWLKRIKKSNCVTKCSLTE